MPTCCVFSDCFDFIFLFFLFLKFGNAKEGFRADFNLWKYF